MSQRSDYQKCLENGWGPGTRLVGDEGFGPTVIELRYVSPEFIVAKRISHNGVESTSRENSWTLSCRDWAEVIEPSPKSAHTCPDCRRLVVRTDGHHCPKEKR